MPESTIDRSAIEELRRAFLDKLAVADTQQQLTALKDEFLGRKSGSLTALLKNLGSLAPEARREFGQLVNSLKSDVEAALDERRAALDDARPAGAVDVSLP